MDYVMKILLILFASVLFVPSAVMADSGNDLLGYCQETVKSLDGEKGKRDQFIVGLCFGMVRGVFETLDYTSLVGSDFKVCMPKNAAIGQSVRVVVSYLKNNPAKLHKKSSLLIMYALLDAFPCKKK